MDEEWLSGDWLETCTCSPQVQLPATRAGFSGPSILRLALSLRALVSSSDWVLLNPASAIPAVPLVSAERNPRDCPPWCWQHSASRLLVKGTQSWSHAAVGVFKTCTTPSPLSSPPPHPQLWAWGTGLSSSSLQHPAHEQLEVTIQYYFILKPENKNYIWASGKMIIMITY